MLTWSGRGTAQTANALHGHNKAQPEWRNNYTACKQAHPEWHKISNYTALKKGTAKMVEK